MDQCPTHEHFSRRGEQLLRTIYISYARQHSRPKGIRRSPAGSVIADVAAAERTPRRDDGIHQCVI